MIKASPQSSLEEDCGGSSIFVAIISTAIVQGGLRRRVLLLLFCDNWGEKEDADLPCPTITLSFKIEDKDHS